MRQVIESRVLSGGVEVALFEWPADGPPVFFAHATGFHARCWDQVIERLPGRHCYALDMRGHGRSDKPPPPYVWRSFGEDVATVVQQLGLRGAIGVGHSKGGHAVTLAASLVPEAFSRLLLVDPVIMPPEHYGITLQGEHFAARRRNHWSSPDEMFQRFKDRPPFATWDPAVLRDYCDYGLLPAPDGHGYVLACPPAVEAATYAGSAGTNVYDAIHEIDIPVRILRAKPRSASGPIDMSTSPTYARLVEHFRHGEDVFLPERTHYMPMEAPDLIARHVLELADVR